MDRFAGFVQRAVGTANCDLKPPVLDASPFATNARYPYAAYYAAEVPPA
jgi:hypothetical protein